LRPRPATGQRPSWYERCPERTGAHRSHQDRTLATCRMATCGRCRNDGDSTSLPSGNHPSTRPANLDRFDAPRLHVSVEITDGEADVAAGFVEGDATFGHQPPDEPHRGSKVVGCFGNGEILPVHCVVSPHAACSVAETSVAATASRYC